ncbi:hypothetical protein KKF04_06730 [Patescibacteria group bacterium]|nr:hypothetical protein [Patescibacteria group bacterium]
MITGATSPLAIEFIKWANSKSYNIIAVSRRSSRELKDISDSRTNNKLIIADLGSTEDIKKVIENSTVKSSQLIFEIYRKESIGKELRSRRPLWIQSFLKY